MKSFKYVYIPADTSQPIEERSCEVPPERDIECLIDIMKAHFKATGPPKTAEAKAAQIAGLQAQLKGQSATPEMLNAITDMQLVENIALLTNTRANGFIGVNLYVDDCGSLRNLPLNPRAAGVAEICGKMLQVNGDAFIGRIFDNEDDFQRLDFTTADLNSSADWVAAARAQEAARAQAEPAQAKIKRMQAAPKEAGPAVVAKDKGNAHFKAGRFPQAIEAYSEAIALDPGFVAALGNRAQAYLNSGALAEAIADCDTVLQKEPKNVKALLRRATAHAKQGGAAAARADYDAVLSLEPHNKEAAKARRALPS